MFFTVRLKKIIIAALLVIAAIICVLLYLKRGDAKAVSTAPPAVLVIDPGHGGIDGGAIAGDGTKESGINLAISLKMKAVAELYGVKTVMTRDSEESRVSVKEYSERADLLRRADIANTTPGCVLISVHQNKFPTPAPIGAQVLYASGDGSRELGLSAQDCLVSFADPDNRRVAAPAPSKLLLTASVSCPAILAECGFMSNPGEVQKLSSPEYQLKRACALTAAYITFSINYAQT